MKSHTKDAIQYGSAVLTMICAWILVFFAFFSSPEGQIHESVIYIYAQSLLYVASLFGISMFVVNAVNTMRKDIDRKIDNKLKDTSKNDTNNK